MKLDCRDNLREQEETMIREVQETERLGHGSGGSYTYGALALLSPLHVRARALQHPRRRLVKDDEDNVYAAGGALWTPNAFFLYRASEELIFLGRDTSRRRHANATIRRP